MQQQKLVEYNKFIKITGLVWFKMNLANADWKKFDCVYKEPQVYKSLSFAR